MPGTWEHSLGLDPQIKKFRNGEYRTAIRVMEERDVRLVRAGRDDSWDWVDVDGRTYDAVGGFPGQYLDGQWDHFCGQIRRHLGKAELVPVDVSQFRADQIERVQRFIAPLGPRVFMVGR
ncbi:hypothetical protein [Kineosporia sp. NBRC 101731]|uniref:hypothetical protein n=1 Tax=Kineosporia sp. NBRC 101731 TaxID=3032199 RepID=UPI0024A06645|nr:hypothetical protein [Kineosporia sp. NBRC 101731]GLY33110.1 hypothetical protein Kisp02_64750 [Kineosporia sp. NBRC 101731]